VRRIGIVLVFFFLLLNVVLLNLSAGKNLLTVGSVVLLRMDGGVHPPVDNTREDPAFEPEHIVPRVSGAVTKEVALLDSKSSPPLSLPESTVLTSSTCTGAANPSGCASAVAWSSQPHLGSSCTYLFLDVGSNIGVHVRFLFEPKLYKPRHKYDNVLDKEFGADRTLRRDKMCAVSFEPNPRHRKRHQDLAEAYARQGWR